MNKADQPTTTTGAAEPNSTTGTAEPTSFLAESTTTTEADDIEMLELKSLTATGWVRQVTGVLERKPWSVAYEF